MWDLNLAERRALAASLFLVGLAGVSRVARTTPRGSFEWRPVVSSVAPESPRDEVSIALAREARAQTPLGPGERIDVASAPEEELRRLAGVGPSLAAAIVRERTARPFRTVDDLDRVPGIGPATFDRLRDHVEVVETVQGAEMLRESSAQTCGTDLVELNTAGAADLERLPGVGPALARRILDARTGRGAFADAQEIREVRGIGEATFSRLAPLICIR